MLLKMSCIDILEVVLLTLCRMDQKYRTSGTEMPRVDDDEYRKEVRRIRKARDGRLPKVLQTEKKRTVEYTQPEWLYNDPPFFRGPVEAHEAHTSDVSSDDMADSLLPEALAQSL